MGHPPRDRRHPTHDDEALSWMGHPECSVAGPEKADDHGWATRPWLNSQV